MSRPSSLLVLAIGLFAGQVFAANPAAEGAPEAVLAASVSAAQRGAFDEAVDQVELLSDRGFVHPDASYARAYAYVERARSRASRPGDLGRAVAALEESLLLRPDAEVEGALSTLRAEISRRRARAGSSPVLQRPSLARAVTSLLPEGVWVNSAVLGSILVTAGLTLYFAVKRRAAEIAGATGIVVGLILGLLGASLAFAARHYRTTSRPAVVVVSEARLLDPNGRALPVRAPNPEAVPEGALVYVHEQRDGRARLEWGAITGWVDASQLRVLMTRAASGE